MKFEGFYAEPSLGHLVGLVRYYVHRMECVSKEEVCVCGGVLFVDLFFCVCVFREVKDVCTRVSFSALTE